MGNLSKHFSDYEFKCPCCGKIKVDNSLIYLLEVVREHFNRPVTITSGYRCPTHNNKVGGTIGSKHLKGEAADIKVGGVKPYDVQNYCDTINKKGGIGRYNTFTHLDICINPEGRR